jgi:hypothetical protein
MLRADSLIRIAERRGGLERELIPFLVLQAGGVREQGLLNLVGDQLGSVEQLMTAERARTKFVQAGSSGIGF